MLAWAWVEKVLAWSLSPLPVEGKVLLVEKVLALIEKVLAWNLFFASVEEKAL